MLTEVAVALPAAEVERKQAEPPVALRANTRAKSELAVSTESVTVEADKTPLTNVPPSAPPLSVGSELCTGKLDEAVHTVLSTVDTATSETAPLAPVHDTMNETAVAADGTVTVVVVASPPVVENTQERNEAPTPVALKEKDRASELAVSSDSVTDEADHTPLTKVPPSGPPLSSGFEVCTAKLAEVVVTLMSIVDTAVTDTALLLPVHCT
jgi:hypothetical protein